MRGCPSCGSIIVCWNWIVSSSSPGHLAYSGHECWSCNACFEVEGLVEDGVPYEALKILKRLEDEGKPVVYTEAMKLLYGDNKK